MSQVESLSFLAPDHITQVSIIESKTDVICCPDKPIIPACPVKPACPEKQCEPVCHEKQCETSCPENPCKTSCSNDSGWEWLGSFILWFIVLIVLFWLIFYSLKPPFVLQSDSNQVDTAKVLLAAVIVAFILVVLIWLIKYAISK